MTVEPTSGDEVDWAAQISQLEALSSQIQAAIEQKEYDRAKQLGDERLALLSMLVKQHGAGAPYPVSLIQLARQLVEAESELHITLRKEKKRLGTNIAKMLTGAKANTLYKKNRQ